VIVPNITNNYVEIRSFTSSVESLRFNNDHGSDLRVAKSSRSRGTIAFTSDMADVYFIDDGGIDWRVANSRSRGTDIFTSDVEDVYFIDDGGIDWRVAESSRSRGAVTFTSDVADVYLNDDGTDWHNAHSSRLGITATYGSRSLSPSPEVPTPTRWCNNRLYVTTLGRVITAGKGGSIPLHGRIIVDREASSWHDLGVVASSWTESNRKVGAAGELYVSLPPYILFHAHCRIVKPLIYAY
jgi:hypothetical protein